MNKALWLSLHGLCKGREKANKIFRVADVEVKGPTIICGEAEQRSQNSGDEAEGRLLSSGHIQ